MSPHHQSAGAGEERPGQLATDGFELAIGGAAAGGKAPEGAWGSATGAATVSRESLQEAGAFLRGQGTAHGAQRITRYAIWAAAAIFFTVCAVLVWYKWAQSREEQAVKLALDYAESEAGKGELGRDGRAALYRLAGQYALNTRKAGSAVEAQNQFHKSLTALGGAGGSGRNTTPSCKTSPSPKSNWAVARTRWTPAQSSSGTTPRRKSMRPSATFRTFRREAGRVARGRRPFGRAGTGGAGGRPGFFPLFFAG